MCVPVLVVVLVLLLLLLTVLCVYVVSAGLHWPPPASTDFRPLLSWILATFSSSSSRSVRCFCCCCAFAASAVLRCAYLRDCDSDTSN